MSVAAELAAYVETWATRAAELALTQTMEAVCPSPSVRTPRTARRSSASRPSAASASPVAIAPSGSAGTVASAPAAVVASSPPRVTTTARVVAPRAVAEAQRARGRLAERAAREAAREALERAKPTARAPVGPDPESEPTPIVARLPTPIATFHFDTTRPASRPLGRYSNQEI